MSWNEHILTVKNKAIKATNILKALCGVTWGAQPQNLMRIYKGYIRAILEWGVTCYGNACNTALSKLDPVENGAIKICLGLLKGTSTFSTLKLANIPSLKSRRQYLVDRYILKVINNTKHPFNTKLKYLEDLIEKRKLKRCRNMGLILDRKKSILEIIIKNGNNISKSELPLCYNYDLEIQLKQLEWDGEIGKSIKKHKDVELANSEFNKKINLKYKHYVKIYTDGSKRDSIESKETRDSCRGSLL